MSSEPSRQPALAEVILLLLIATAVLIIKFRGERTQVENTNLPHEAQTGAAVIPSPPAAPNAFLKDQFNSNIPQELEEVETKITSRYTHPRRRAIARSASVLIPKLLNYLSDGNKLSPSVSELLTNGSGFTSEDMSVVDNTSDEVLFI